MSESTKVPKDTKNSKIVTGPGRVPYVAFNRLSRSQYSLKTRPKDDIWRRLNYDALLRIEEDQFYGKAIGLYFTFAVVLIKGRNLQSIADAIDVHQCEYVQEFDSQRWPEPTDEKAPFISELWVEMIGSHRTSSSRTLVNLSYS
jgi:hypothetical protein